MKNIPHIDEFSKNSKHYHDNSDIQQIVAKKLVENIKVADKTVLDLGCGSGYVYKLLDKNFKSFIGVDLSLEMLSLHDRGGKVTLECKDFDDIKDFKGYDLILSSSSLQWSKDMKRVITLVQRDIKEFAFAIFSDGTFREFREYFAIDTFLLSSEKIKSFFTKDVKFETKVFQKEFNSSKELLRYIKKSGVSGGVKKMPIYKLRKFIKENRIKTLKFEVLFVWSLS